MDASQETLSETLVETEDLYRLVAELSTDCTFAFAVAGDGTLSTEWLAGDYRRMFGYGPALEDVRRWPEAVHPDDRAVATACYRRLLAGYPSSCELRVLCADGTARWIYAYGYPIQKDDRTVRIIGALRDITIRKRAEEALRESEALYRNLLAAFPDAVVVTSPDGTILDASDRAGHLYGVDSFEDLLGQNLLSLLDPSARERVGQILQEALQGKDVRNVELVLHGDQGETVLEVSATLARDVQGRPCLLLVIPRDITVRKKAEEALQGHILRLEALHALDRSALEILPAEEIAQVALTHLSRLLPCARSSIFLLDPGRRASVLVVQGQGKERVGPRRVFVPNPAMVESFVAGCRIRIVPDIAAQPNPSPIEEDLLAAGVRAYANIGLQARQEWIGALNIGLDRVGPPDEQTMAVACEIADSLATALDYVRLRQEESRRRQELEALRQASLHLTSHLELQPVLDAILDHALRLVQADDAHIFVYDGTTFTLGTARWADGRPRPPIAPRPEGLTHTVARSGRPLVVPQVEEHPLFADYDWSGAIVGLPLQIGERVVGVMNVAYAEPHDFGPDELRVLELLADQAAIAIENARLHEEVRRHAAELEQRVAERTAELEQSRARMQVQYRSIPVPTYTWQRLPDGDFVLVDYNDAAYNVTQGRIEGCMGRQLSALYPDRPEVLAMAERCLRERTILEREFIHRSKRTGQESHLVVKCAFAPPDLVLMHVEDVTARKEAEEEIRRHVARIERLNRVMSVLLQDLQGTNLRLAETGRQLAEANEQLETFALSIAHALRAPLRAIEGFAHSLEKDYRSHLPEEAQDDLQRILSSARQMDDLVLDLLTYSRLSRTELPLESLDLDGIVREALEQEAAQIEQAGAQVVAEEGGLRVHGHRPALEQTVANLISNAIKFVPSQVRPQVRIWSEAHGERVRLYVQDNGIGIPAAEQEHIFGLFERLHGVETYPGTGIGLAIVQKAVERMGGRVGSEPGRGSLFWIELERAE